MHDGEIPNEKIKGIFVTDKLYFYERSEGKVFSAFTCDYFYNIFGTSWGDSNHAPYQCYDVTGDNRKNRLPKLALYQYAFQ